MQRRVLQISLTADPLNPLDGGDLGGQQIVVREASLRLQQEGFGVDVATVPQHPMLPNRASLGQRGQVIRISRVSPPVSDNTWAQMEDHLAHELIDWIDNNHRRYQLVHSHFWVSGMVASHIASHLEVPWVHSPYKMADWVRRPQNQYSEVRMNQERQLLAKTDAVVIPYLKEADLVHQYAPNVPLYVVAPGVDATTFFNRDPGPVLKGLGLSRRPLLYVGHLDAGRGIHEVLEYMASQKLADDLVLLLIGGNRGDVVAGHPQDPALAKLADTLGHHVRFLGPMPHRAVAMYMATAQAVLAPNQGPTLGMAVVEALASGTPVIGTKAPGVADWIEAGVNGFVCDINDVATFWHYASILWNDADLAHKMGIAGQTTIHHNHNSDSMASQLAQVYDEVCQGYSPNADVS
ncbi:MAG: glycosyltransferase [Sulfobacillus sp.]